MNTVSKLLLAAIVAPVAFVAAPAAAQVNGVAVANPEGAIANTRAWTTARTQIQTTHKGVLDQAEARSRAIQAELQPLVTQFNAARAAPNPNQAALQTQAQSIQSKQQAAEAELARITAPAQRAQAYALEQLQGRLSEAAQNVVRQRNIQVLLRPDVLLLPSQAADVTPLMTAELDRLVPTVNINVPANWQPGQQQAAAGARPAAAPAATPARTGGR